MESYGFQELQMNFVYFFDQNNNAVRMYVGKPENYQAMCDEYGLAYYLVGQQEIPLIEAKNIDGQVVRVPFIPVLDYRQKRAMEYPALGDQMDMIWHSMDNGVTPKIEPFYSAIKAVKDKYPKE
jgi:hypothetical protein